MRSGVRRGRCGVPGEIHFYSGQGTIMLPVRRCLGLGLLVAVTAVLSLGAAFAQTGDQKGGDKGVVGDKKEQPKDVQAAPKTYAIEYRNAPWADVLDFLVKITDLPFLGVQRPTGTFTFISN